MKFIKILIIILGVVLLVLGGFELYQYIRIKTAKIEVSLVEDMTLEFNDTKKVSDYITSINGKIIDDYIIDSTTLGDKQVTFKFINDENIKLKYTYNIKVVDTVKPLIWLGNSYSIPKDSTVDLKRTILCGDNYDSNPNCFIEGEYDAKTVGNYDLVFKAIDNSGNMSEQPFTLNVYEPVPSEKKEESFTNFSDVVKNYKGNNTKIGIDVSKWQGNIDFAKIKDAGVEFIIIKVGSTDKETGNNVMDKNFEYNISEANKYGIKTGLYFYSYASTSDQAKRDAEWVIEQAKKYNVFLPIAFDWEEWSHFNDYHLSFFGLNNMADEFIKIVESAGYDAILYSSKSYLEHIWDYLDNDVWLAHYTSVTDYAGKYKLWQICSDGVVDGIDTYVDIDILYE